MSPDKGAHRAVAVATETGLPLKLAGKMQEPKEREYFHELVEPHLVDGDRVSRRGHARREGRAAAERARDALSDRVGGAVRPRHDRVDGLRDAGDRDALGRGAGGDRARPQRHHRRPLQEMADALERADALDPLELRRYVEEEFSPQRMVRDYVAAYEAAIAAAGSR